MADEAFALSPISACAAPLSEADFDAVLRINLKGSFLVGQAVGGGDGHRRLFRGGSARGVDASGRGGVARDVL